MKANEHLLPKGITHDFKSVKTLKDFDDRFTAPLNGFIDAFDYWEKCSCQRFIADTAIPMLIINAKDDPILGRECFPYTQALACTNIFLEVPEHGGHMGFVTFGNKGEYWHETRAVEFCEQYTDSK